MTQRGAWPRARALHLKQCQWEWDRYPRSTERRLFLVEICNPLVHSVTVIGSKPINVKHQRQKVRSKTEVPKNLCKFLDSVLFSFVYRSLCSSG